MGEDGADVLHLQSPEELATAKRFINIVERLAVDQTASAEPNVGEEKYGSSYSILEGSILHIIPADQVDFIIEDLRLYPRNPGESLRDFYVYKAVLYWDDDEKRVFRVGINGSKIERFEMIADKRVSPRDEALTAMKSFVKGAETALQEGTLLKQS